MADRNVDMRRDGGRMVGNPRPAAGPHRAPAVLPGSAAPHAAAGFIKQTQATPKLDTARGRRADLLARLHQRPGGVGHA